MRAPLAFALLALLGGASPPAPQPMPVHVGGRVVPEGRALGFGWPGVYFESRFAGTGFRVRFEGPAEHMRLLVDGREIALFGRAPTADFTVSGLPAGEHVVRLEKQTESQSGGGLFHGFFPLPGDRPLPPPSRARAIEFIGDSYTIGYGNSSAKRECTGEEVHDTTDTQSAFGPLVARRFDADYRIVAYSGFGIVRNYNGGSPGLSLPVLYPRLKPDDPAHLETDSRGWRPQLIVINLGTNDFSTPVKAGEKWADRAMLEADYRRTYAGFVRTLAERQPQARFVLMGSDDFLPQVEQVAAALPSDLRARVSTLRFGDLALGGCNYHPSLADDRKLAELVAAQIERVKPW